MSAKDRTCFITLVTPEQIIVPWEFPKRASSFIISLSLIKWVRLKITTRVTGVDRWVTLSIPCYIIVHRLLCHCFTNLGAHRAPQLLTACPSPLLCPLAHTWSHARETASHLPAGLRGQDVLLALSHSNTVLKIVQVQRDNFAENWHAFQEYSPNSAQGDSLRQRERKLKGKRQRDKHCLLILYTAYPFSKFVGGLESISGDSEMDGVQSIASTHLLTHT